MPLKSMKDAWPSRDAYRQERGHTKAPVSELERATLAAFRATPVLEAHLTPMGTVAKEVRHDVETQREARITFIAYTVRDRGAEKDAAWNRVGAAWQHRDGKGYDLHLDASPVDGRVTLREQRREDYREARKPEPSRREQDRER